MVVVAIAEAIEQWRRLICTNDDVFAQRVYMARCWLYAHIGSVSYV